MRTGLNIGLTFRAASHTFIALLIHLNRNCFRFSENSIHELDAHLHEAVIPLTRSVACATTSTTAKASAEKGTEDISEVLKTAKASAEVEVGDTNPKDFPFSDFSFSSRLIP